MPHRSPVRVQWSESRGKRRGKERSAVFAARRKRSEADFAPTTGVYRFRRGYGGGISGRRRLTAIKRAIYKSNNNNTVAVAA